MSIHHLLMAAAAASILLTSAALAAAGIPHQTRRAGDHFTVITDDNELMCKVAGDQSSRSWAPPPGWTNAIVHLREEGDIRCTASMTNGS